MTYMYPYVQCRFVNLLIVVVTIRAETLTGEKRREWRRYGARVRTEKAKLYAQVN